MKKTILFVIGILMSGSLLAAPYCMAASEIGASAKTIGRGYIEGYEQRAHSVFENPATMTAINKGSIGVFSARLMNEVTYRNIALAAPTPIGKLGFGFMEAISYGFYHTGEGSKGRFYEESSFDWRDSIYKLSFQRDVLDWLSLGTTFVSYNRYFHTISATGWDIDLGTFCDFDWLQLSFVGRNLLGHSVTHVDAKDPSYIVDEELPFQGIASMKLRWAEFHVLTQVKVVPNYRLAFYALEYKPWFIPLMTLRIGHREVLVQQDIKNSLTAGFGIEAWGIIVDIAYEKSDYFEFDHKVYTSLCLDF